MKQKIYEMPVWDAFQLENCECGLCSIEKKSEDNFIESLFTEMVMDVRLNPQLVKDYDFCHEHFEKLYRYPDKCGLAVLTNRILYAKRQGLKDLKANSNNTKKPSIKDFFTFRNKELQPVKEKQCLLCSRLHTDMDNYIETFIQLWCKENTFRELYANSRGLCLKHFSTVLKSAPAIIKNTETIKEFEEASFKTEEENLARIQEELEWFISKFDYRYADEPWKTSKDALIRTIQKLIGTYNSKI